MQYLAYNRPYGKSARKLAEAMHLTPLRFGRMPRLGTAIAWGAPSVPTPALNGSISVNKLEHLQTWKSADLQSLPFSTSMVESWMPRSGTSFGGRDFLAGRQMVPQYWTKPVLDVKMEYRVHLCRLPGQVRGNPSSYRVIRLGYKVNADPGLNIKSHGVPIRSRQFGWHLKYFSPENLGRNLQNKLSLLSRWAIATIGWDFGAIDVLHTEDNQYVLLEANSAPGLLDDNTCRAYANALSEVIDVG